MFMLPQQEVGLLEGTVGVKFSEKNSDLVLDNGGLEVVLWKATVAPSQE